MECKMVDGFLVVREGGVFTAWRRWFGGIEGETRTFRHGWSTVVYARIGSGKFSSQADRAERVRKDREKALDLIVRAYPEASEGEPKDGRVHV